VDYAGFLREVGLGRVPAVALLHGPEPLLLEDAVASVAQALFPSDTDLSLAREAFDAKDASPDAIVQAALTLPWTGTHRLVVVKGVEALGSRQGERIAAYVRSPNPSTVLLLLASIALAPSHWLLGAVPRTSIVPVLRPTGAQLTAWLRQRARADGFTLDDDAAAILIDLCGDDLTQLRGEVEKAALAGGPDNRRIGAAEVRAVVGEHRLHSIFELTRALSLGDAASALRLTESLQNAGEDPLGVLAMLAREVRGAWQVTEGLRIGRREEEIARELRRPPAAATALIRRARSMPTGAPMRLLKRTWETERRLKLGGAPRAELSLLIADLCAG
jgi:DNA polymerase-3 subunit delta